MPDVDPRIVERAARVRVVLLDVDGVLSDGRIVVDGEGGEWKAFYVRDGMGIRLAQEAGLRIAIVSGRSCRAVARRARELRIEQVHQGVRDKLGLCRELVRGMDVAAEQTCFIGDDVNDVPAMRWAGLAAAPADAAEEARAAAHHVTRAPGGRGAVREVLDLVLRAGGQWDALLQRLFPD